MQTRAAHVCTFCQLRNMILKSWAWAKAQNKIRVNEVHGDEEIYIVASETFDISSTNMEESTQNGSITVQANMQAFLHTHTCICMIKLLDIDMPAIFYLCI